MGWGGCFPGAPSGRSGLAGPTSGAVHRRSARPAGERPSLRARRASLPCLARGSVRLRPSRPQCGAGLSRPPGLHGQTPRRTSWAGPGAPSPTPSQSGRPESHGCSGGRGERPPSSAGGGRGVKAWLGSQFGCRNRPRGQAGGALGRLSPSGSPGGWRCSALLSGSPTTALRGRP